MKAWQFALGLTIGFLSTVASSAAVVVDQDWSTIPAPPMHGNNSRVGQAIDALPYVTFIEIAQTFTVGITGTLARVDVLVHRLPITEGGLVSGSSDLVLDIWRAPLGTIGGDPNDLLGSVSVSKDAVPVRETNPVIDFDLVKIDVLSLGIAVSMDDHLAISLRSSGVYPVSLEWNTPYVWLGTDSMRGLDYSGGYRWSRGLPVDGIWRADWLDQAFRTYVSAVPEPSTYALMLAGTCMLGIAARRRRVGRQFT